MAAVLQHRRMSTTARLLITPANGELIWDTSTLNLYMGDGVTVGGIPIGGGLGTFTVESKTADYSVTAAESGVHFNTGGAAGTVIFSLPPGVAGLNYVFLVGENFTLEVLATGGERIALGSSLGGADGNIQCATMYAMLSIESHGFGFWFVRSATGIWTLT